MEVDKSSASFSILTEAKIKVKTIAITLIPQVMSLRFGEDWILIQTPLFTVEELFYTNVIKRKAKRRPSNSKGTSSALIPKCQNKNKVQSSTSF